MKRLGMLVLLLLVIAVLLIACAPAPTPVPTAAPPTAAPKPAATSPGSVAPTAASVGGSVIFLSTQHKPVEEAEGMRSVILKDFKDAKVEFIPDDDGPYQDRIVAEQKTGKVTLGVLGALHGTFPVLLQANALEDLTSLAAKLKDPINFSIGQPDFDVPDSCKDAADILHILVISQTHHAK